MSRVTAEQASRAERLFVDLFKVALARPCVPAISDRQIVAKAIDLANEALLQLAEEFECQPGEVAEILAKGRIIR